MYCNTIEKSFSKPIWKFVHESYLEALNSKQLSKKLLVTQQNNFIAVFGQVSPERKGEILSSVIFVVSF